MGPLTGVKVLELAQIMAGPTCGMMLADLGADVIKVERVPGGDDTRRTDRPSVNGESASFMSMNRNKRGIALNLKLPAAQDALKRMAARADVVTENYRKARWRSSAWVMTCCKINPGSSIAPSPASAAPARTPTRAATTLSRRACRGLMGVTGEPGARRRNPAGRSATSMRACSARSA